jgi:hypothetical protein
VTSRNLINNLWLAQQQALPPLDLYDVEPHEHHVVLREHGVTFTAPVSEIDLGVAEHGDVIGLSGGGTDHVGGIIHRVPSSLPRRWDAPPDWTGEAALENLLQLVGDLAVQIDREFRWQRLIMDQLMVRH